MCFFKRSMHFLRNQLALSKAWCLLCRNAAPCSRRPCTVPCEDILLWRNAVQPPTSMCSEHVNIFTSRVKVKNCQHIWYWYNASHLHKLRELCIVRRWLVLQLLLPPSQSQYKLLRSYACQCHVFNAILQSFSFFILIGGGGDSVYLHIYIGQIQT